MRVVGFVAICFVVASCIFVGNIMVIHQAAVVRGRQQLLPDSSKQHLSVGKEQTKLVAVSKPNEAALDEHVTPPQPEQRSRTLENQKRISKAQLNRGMDVANALHNLEQLLHKTENLKGTHEKRLSTALHSKEVSDAVQSATTPEERVLHLCTKRRMKRAQGHGGSMGNVRVPRDDPMYDGALRVMQYNVYDGIENEQRKKWIGDWIQGQRIDVLTLNELNGWSAKYLSEIANAWGFEFSELLDTGAYNMGVLSKFSLTVLSKHVGGTFNHGFLQVRVNHPRHSFRVLVTHLSPFEATKRVKEVEALIISGEGGVVPVHTIFVKVFDGPSITVSLKEGASTGVSSVLKSFLGLDFFIKSPEKRRWALYHGSVRLDRSATLEKYDVRDGDVLELKDPHPGITYPKSKYNYKDRLPSQLTSYSADEPLLVMGDLNSLSPLDKAAYAQAGLLQHLLAIKNKDARERVIKKFLRTHPSLRGSFAIDYSPIQSFLNFGYVDYVGERAKEAGSLLHTVPTMLQLDYMHAARMRLDYIMGNRAFQKEFGKCASAHAVQSACTEILSDHLPAVLTFRPGVRAGEACRIPHETNVSSCSWKTLCAWRKSWEEQAKMRGVERQQICEHKRQDWNLEERGALIASTELDFPFFPKTSEMSGISCNEVCRNSDDHGGVTLNEIRVGQEVSSSFCVQGKMGVINTCERLKVSFDCIHGCRGISGHDQPSFVSVDTDEFYGFCLHNPKGKVGTCSGNHFSTTRLCPCGKASWVPVKSRMGESCTAACRRVSAHSVCAKSLLRLVDDCTVMANAFGCTVCEKMKGKDLPAYVSNEDNPYHGSCLVHEDHEKVGVDAPVFCDESHPDTTRLCACANVSRLKKAVTRKSCGAESLDPA